MSTLQNASQGYRSLMQQNKTRSARTIYAEIPGLKTIKKKSTNMQGGIVSPYMIDSAKNELSSSNTTDENRSETFGSNMFIPCVKVQEKNDVGGKSPLDKNASDAELEANPKLRGKEEGEVIKGTVDDDTGMDNKKTEIIPSGVNQIKRDSGDPLKKLNGRDSKQESNIPSVEKSMFIPKVHMDSEFKSNHSRESFLNSNGNNDRAGSIHDSYARNGVSSDSIPKGHELKGGFDSFKPPSGVNIPPKEVRSDHMASSIKMEDRSSSFYGDMDLGFNEGKGTPPLSRGPPPMVVPPMRGPPPPGGAVKPVYFERPERGGTKFATMPNGTYNGHAMEGPQTKAPVVGANGRDSFEKSNDDIARSIPVRPPPNMYPTKKIAEEDENMLANRVSEQNEKALSMSGNFPRGFSPQKEKGLIEHFLSALNKSLTKEDEDFRFRLKLETEKLHSIADKGSALDTLYRKLSQLKSIQEESEDAEVLIESHLDEGGSTTQGREEAEVADQSKVNNILHLINSKNEKIKREMEIFMNSYNELRKGKTKNEEIIRLYKKREKKNLHILKEMAEKERRRSDSFKKKEKKYQEEIMEGKRNLQLEIMNREQELERVMREQEVSLRMKDEELETLKGKEAALKEELKKVESEAEKKVSILKDEFEMRRTKEMEELGNEQREVTKGAMEEEVRGELRGELRHEVMAELRSELKDEVIGELQTELKDEVMTELRTELKDEVMAELRTELKDEVIGELRTELKDEAAGDLEKAKKLAEDNFNSKLEKYKEKMEENKNDFINSLIIEKNGEVEALRCQLEKMKNEEISQLKEEQQRALNENMEQMRQSLQEEHQQHMEELKRECESQKSREIEALRGEVSRREEELETMEKELMDERERLARVEKQLSEEQEEKLAQLENSHEEKLAQMENSHEEKLAQMENSHEEKLAQLENSHEEKLAQLHGEIDRLHSEMNQMAKEKRHLELNVALLKEEKENAMNRNQNLEDNLKNNEEIHNRRVNLLQEQKDKLEKEIKEIIQNKRKESEQIREKFADLLQAEINRIKKESEQKVHTYVKQYEEMSEEYETKKKEFSDMLEKANSNNKDLNKKYEENIIKINEYEGMIKMLENQTEQMVRNKIEELNEEFEKKKEIFEKEKKELLQNCAQLEENHKKIKQQLENEINLALQENEQNIVRITSTYESRVHEMEKRCELLMSQCSELKMKNDEMMESFCREKAQRERSLERLSSANDELTTQNDQLATKNDQLVTKNDQLVTKNDQLATKNDQLVTKNDQLATQNDQLSDNLNEVKNELSTLQGKYEQVASQNAHLKSSEKEQKKLSHRLSDLKNINRDLIRVTEKERELNVKNVNIIKSLQAQIKEQTNLYKEYTDELKDEIEKLKRVTESESNSSLSQLFNENKKLKLQNEVITTKSETMSAALDSLTKRLSFIEASIRDNDYGQEVIRRADELQ